MHFACTFVHGPQREARPRYLAIRATNELAESPVISLTGSKPEVPKPRSLGNSSCSQSTLYILKVDTGSFRGLYRGR